MAKQSSNKPIKRPPFEGLYPYIVFICLGYFITDVAMLEVRTYMLPDTIPLSKPSLQNNSMANMRGAFSQITSRNIFSSDGKIPDTLFVKNQKPADKEEGQKDLPPVPSSLPLALVGTIVHSNPEKSIANIEMKSKNLVIALRPNNEIDTLATLVSVERGKIIIRNSNNGRLEFIELKDKNKLSFNSPKAVVSSGKTKEDVKVVGQNEFEIKRSDILKYTSDMSSILQQAAMQPHRNAAGEIDGFKFLNIQPGSIYTQLGFQVGDTIKAVNGEPVNNPAKAMELYNALKGSDNVKILTERDGREQTHNYNIK